VDISVGVESPLQDDVRAMVAELDTALLKVTPAEYCLLLPVEEMAGPETTVFVARRRGEAVGIGALRRHPGGVGEVKRMYVKPEVQGQGVGKDILDAIEARARKEGLSRLVLETGSRLSAASKLYERSGFSRCGAFLGYPETPASVFYEKALADGERPRP
jgi:putative acetyltransferase